MKWDRRNDPMRGRGQAAVPAIIVKEDGGIAALHVDHAFHSHG